MYVFELMQCGGMIGLEYILLSTALLASSLYVTDMTYLTTQSSAMRLAVAEVNASMQACTNANIIQRRSEPEISDQALHRGLQVCSVD